MAIVGLTNICVCIKKISKKLEKDEEMLEENYENFFHRPFIYAKRSPQVVSSSGSVMNGHMNF